MTGSRIAYFIRKNRLIIIVFWLYFPMIFLGYGTDNDTYRVLKSCDSILDTGSYTPSRNPGYIVHELITLLLSGLGGSILSNAGSLIIALISIKCFLLICRHFNVSHSEPLAAILAIHPLFWINATATHDYVWALGFILAGFLLLIKRKYTFAGLAMGLAVGTRLASFIAIGEILVFFWLIEPTHRKKLYPTALIVIAGGVLSYLPSFIHANCTFNFLAPGISWEYFTPLLRTAKFIYKSVYFWGPIGSIILVCMGWLIIRNHRKAAALHPWFPITVLSAAIILSYHLLFLKYPIENEYMLPILPFCLLLIGTELKNKPILIHAFLLAVLSFNFININIIKPDVPGRSTNAEIGLWIEKGYLIDELQKRFYLRHCEEIGCWGEVMQQNPSFRRSR